jgi:hypothetical protein
MDSNKEKTKLVKVQTDWVIVPLFGFGRIKDTTFIEGVKPIFEIHSVTWMFIFLAKKTTKTYSFN